MKILKEMNVEEEAQDSFNSFIDDDDELAEEKRFKEYKAKKLTEEKVAIPVGKDREMSYKSHIKTEIIKFEKILGDPKLETVVGKNDYSRIVDGVVDLLADLMDAINAYEE